MVAGLLLARRAPAFWGEFGKGLTILRSPVRYLRSVVSYQALGWGCRVGGCGVLLGGVQHPGAPRERADRTDGRQPRQPRQPLPGDPGGLGSKQALLVVMLAGTAGRTDVLACSAGMELILLAVSALLGLACLAAMLRSLRFRQPIAQARSDHGGPAPG